MIRSTTIDLPISATAMSSGDYLEFLLFVEASARG